MPLKQWGEKSVKKDGGRVADTKEFPACGMTLTIGIALCSTAWVQKIKAASEQYIETEKKKREKAYQGTCHILYSPLIHVDTWAGPFGRVPECLCRIWSPSSDLMPVFTVAANPFVSDFFVPSSLTENLRNRTFDGACDWSHRTKGL